MSEGYKKISFKISDNLAYQHASLATNKKRRKNILKESKPTMLVINYEKTRKTASYLMP